MTKEEHNEIMRFQITVWMIELTHECSPTGETAAEAIIAEAAFGPCKNITTD